jgi:hypothetical protein
MTEEQRMIKEFIKKNGVTKLPPDVRIIVNSALAWKEEYRDLEIPDNKPAKKRKKQKKQK